MKVIDRDDCSGVSYHFLDTTGEIDQIGEL